MVTLMHNTSIKKQAFYVSQLKSKLTLIEQFNINANYVLPGIGWVSVSFTDIV